MLKSILFVALLTLVFYVSLLAFGLPTLILLSVVVFLLNRRIQRA